MLVSARPAAFHVTFSAPQAELRTDGNQARLLLPSPLLAGPDTEMIGAPAAEVHWEGDILVARQPQTLIGALLVDASGRLEEVVEQAYLRILEITRGWHLYRVWNYLPGINDVRLGLERYQQFNIGRWAAFESFFGQDLRAFMPAASAVGLPGSHAAILFKAGMARPTYLENPSQIPAYHYPADYGPRPPSFARGVIASRPPYRLALLSGTASIEGHRSIGEGDWLLQFRTTLRNIHIMLERMQVSSALTPALWEQDGIESAAFKCYLRHPESLPLVREWVQETCGSDEHFCYVQADICRSNLDLEIEGYARAHGRTL